MTSKWTKTEDNMLEMGYLRGTPAADIAKRIGRSTYAVQKRASRLGLKRQKASKIPHGTVSGYSYWKCRCELCRAANAKAQREYQQKRRKNAGS
jgi:hypothetical protein